MAKEIELKLTALSEDIERVLPELVKALKVVDLQEAFLTNTYYDTPEALLNKSKVALRIREKDGCYIQTFKTKGKSVAGVHQRGEWEWYLASNKLDETLLSAVGWPENVDVKNLAPYFSTNFKRTSGVINYKDSKIELAVDVGYIEAGGVRSPLSEIELEIIEGCVDSLFDVASEIAKILPVMLADVSKAEKGYRQRNQYLSNKFDYTFNCEGDYKAYIKNLIEENLARWIYWVDRASYKYEGCVLEEVKCALVMLKGVVSSYGCVDPLSVFRFSRLFDSELSRLNEIHKERVNAGQVVSRLLSSKETGVLAIELGRWLRNF